MTDKDDKNAISWAEYKEKFGKSYPTEELDAAHKNVFLETQKMIQEHNAQYDRGEKTFTLGLNQLADLLPQEKEHMRGHLPRE